MPATSPASTERRCDRVSLPPATTERGVAVIWAIAGLLIIAGTAFVGLQRIASREATDSAGFQLHGQALGVARAGLIDAQAWMRRQPDQPVTRFAPVNDPSAVPPVDETEDADIGLVRTYDLGGGLWARYEVRRGRPADPFTDDNENGVHDPAELFVDLTDPGGSGFSGDLSNGYGDGEWTPALWTRDVSTERGLATAGSVWRLESRGLVFRRPRADLPLGVGANTLVATSVLATEIQRLTIAPPAAAALCVASPSGASLVGRVRVQAQRVGVAFASSSAALSASGLSDIQAPIASVRIPDYPGASEDVFGVDRAMLRSMADTSTSAAGDGVPDPIPDGHLVVHDGDVVFDSTHRLRGRGILVVFGDLEIRPDSDASFTGLIYCEGDVLIKAPATLRGTVIATGGATLYGSVSDYVDLVHDPKAVSDLIREMGLYRVIRASYVPDPGHLATTPPDPDPAKPWPPAPGPGGTGAWGAWGGWEPSTP